jgi:sugar phosphate isomerase/epimerase
MNAEQLYAETQELLKQQNLEAAGMKAWQAMREAAKEAKAAGNDVRNEVHRFRMLLNQCGIDALEIDRGLTQIQAELHQAA